MVKMCIFITGRIQMKENYYYRMRDHKMRLNDSGYYLLIAVGHRSILRKISRR